MAQTESKQGSSRSRLLQLLLDADKPLGVESLAQSLKISRNAIYQHITALERDGLIERAELSQTRGRPGQTYQLSRAGRATFTRHYALFAEMLLELMKSRLGSDELEAGLEELGRDLSNRFLERVAGLEGGAQMKEIARIMRELGYESRAVNGKGEHGAEIVAHNCVFHDLAERHREVCKLDIALISALAGDEIEHAECMVRGGACCRFRRKS